MIDVCVPWGIFFIFLKKINQPFFNKFQLDNSRKLKSNQWKLEKNIFFQFIRIKNKYYETI